MVLGAPKINATLKLVMATESHHTLELNSFNKIDWVLAFSDQLVGCVSDKRIHIFFAPHH